MGLLVTTSRPAAHDPPGLGRSAALAVGTMLGVADVELGAAIEEAGETACVGVGLGGTGAVVHATVTSPRENTANLPINFIAIAQVSRMSRPK